ncbi:undecaprenyl/decaprenyl-phosphate alpha-N-acetylglucosaminyl 1-phosphate transferase [Flavobacteriaceae bacterium]|nr:undecaprenyl/decaprenyl-phosphate alpha-N-acetylglucosaminyl 1-phosphate transferase [Flavobacteriaceae bacterium]
MELSLLVVAFIIATLLHFAVQKLFIHYKRFDDFNHRSSHKTLATRTGGIGIFLTVLIISLYYYFQGIEVFDYSLFIPLGIMFIVGVYDDLYNADFKLKFLLQIIVAKILIDQGYVISNYHGLFGLYEVPWLLAQSSTVFIFLVIVNAINFIDGIDGLAISEVIKTILLIEFFSAGFTELFPLGFVLVATILPLYYFNYKKKRKVFLGDGGSLLLGTLVMIYVLYVLGPDYRLNPKYQINIALFSIMIILYPLVDLFRVFVLRIIDGKSPFIADQRHIHHRINEIINNPINTTLIILSLEFTLIWTYIFYIWVCTSSP